TQRRRLVGRERAAQAERDRPREIVADDDEEQLSVRLSEHGRDDAGIVPILPFAGGGLAVRGRGERESGESEGERACVHGGPPAQFGSKRIRAAPPRGLETWITSGPRSPAGGERARQ